MMEEKEAGLKTEFVDLQERLTAPDIYASKDYPKLAKRVSYLETVLKLFEDRRQLQSQINQSKDLVSASDVELAAMAQAELVLLTNAIVLLKFGRPPVVMNRVYLLGSCIGCTPVGLN
jgi:protein subunit release factor A